MKRTYSLDEFGVTKHQLTLENGLQVVFVEKPLAPIYAKLMIRAGSIFNNGDTGLAHFTEHILVSGSEKYQKKEDFAGITASVGGYANANTSLIQLCVECEVAIRDHMKNMKEYFSESLTDLRITPELLQKEIGIITSETKGRLSKPDYIAARFEANIWGKDTNWSNSNLGTLEAIAATTIKDIEKFFTTYCCVENMLLVISGGCSISDVVDTFSDIRFLHGTKSYLPSDAPRVSPNQRLFLEQNIEQSNIGIFFNAPEIGTKEYLLLNFALQYAHDGLSSRFYKKLRNERGLVYGVGVSRAALSRIAYLGTSTSTPPEKIDAVLDAIFECYSELLSEGIPQKQFENKLETIWFSTMRTLETAHDWVKEFSKLYPETSPLIGDFPHWHNYMETVNIDEVNEVLRKFITFDNYHLGMNGRKLNSKYF